MKKHYRIEIRTKSGKIINVNYFTDGTTIFKRFTQLVAWHENESMSIFEKGKNKPLITYN